MERPLLSTVQSYHCPLFYLLLCSSLFGCGNQQQTEQVGSGLPPSEGDVLADSPRFVVRLPDNNLLCFAIDGFELFTYNLITSHYLVVNGFLNVTEYHHKDKHGPKMKKGFTEVGVMIRSIDKRMRGGSRLFRHRVSGAKKKAYLEKFGEVDIHQGAVVFGLDQEGHSSIESEQAKHEMFQLTLEKPKVNVKAVSGDGSSFNIYVENSTGLVSSGSHGLLGQFLSPKVRINTATGELITSDGSTVPVEKALVWESLRDGVYPGYKCWYPKQENSVIQGNSWDYIVEHIMSTKYEHTLF